MYGVTSVSQAFTLHPTAAVGTWKFCHRPSSQGLWTHVTGVSLSIIPKPSYAPNVGIAGSVTPLTFSGVRNGDYIVLDGGDCSNASGVVTGAFSRARQTIANLTVSTSVSMVGLGNVSVCYATLESGGESADDYTRLDVKLLQVQPPTSAAVRCGMLHTWEPMAIIKARLDNSLDIRLTIKYLTLKHFGAIFIE